MEAVRDREESIRKCKLAYVDEEVLVEVVNESQLGEALTGAASAMPPVDHSCFNVV